MEDITQQDPPPLLIPFGMLAAEGADREILVIERVHEDAKGVLTFAEGRLILVEYFAGRLTVNQALVESVGYQFTSIDGQEHPRGKHWIDESRDITNQHPAVASE